MTAVTGPGYFSPSSGTQEIDGQDLGLIGLGTGAERALQSVKQSRYPGFPIKPLAAAILEPLPAWRDRGRSGFCVCAARGACFCARQVESGTFGALPRPVWAWLRDRRFLRRCQGRIGGGAWRWRRLIRTVPVPAP